ncbi:MAG TPA: hypothetical protein VFV99_00460 [Kofleriaceae bacterium]|nr:hypothetical protein [Kofleriaceae bacterium]
MVLLAGCDLLFQIDDLTGHTDAGGSADSVDATQDMHTTNCVADDFAMLGTQWTMFENPPTAVVAIDGTLSISLNKAADDHGGIDSAVRDFTGASIEVDVVTVPDTSSETYMEWDRGHDWYSIAVDHGELSYGYSVDGSDRTIEIPYEPDKHRRFKLAHDRQANLIRMSVRNSLGEWTELGTVPVSIPMTALTVELASGSYTAALTSGVARFDNFVTCF